MRALSIAGSEFPPRKMSSLQYFTVVRTAVLSKKVAKGLNDRKQAMIIIFYCLLVPQR